MSLETRAGAESIRKSPQKLLIAEPRGLCAGVIRSLDAFDKAIEKNPGKTLYSVGEPAHNTHINKRYQEMGIIFVNSVEEVPSGAEALLGPHGTEVEEFKMALEKGLTIWDTTCPLVTKVEDEIASYTEKGIITIYWGDKNHQEAKSAISSGDVILVESEQDSLSDEVFEKTKGKNGVAFASQTTFNADEALLIEEKLKEKYKTLITPKVPDRCYATRNRQAAVKEMIKRGATFIVVVGSPESSNSRRLYEVALENGAKAVFVDSSEDLDVEILSGDEIIGFESGASVEEDKFQEVVSLVKSRYALEAEPVMVSDEKRIKFAPVRVVSYEPQFVYPDMQK